MYKWIIRVSAATVGTVLLVMIKSLNFNPILYIFPLMMILLAFLNCAEDSEGRPVADDVRKVVIRSDNRRWDFADEECSRTSKTIEEKNQRNIKIGIGVR
ncbi:MAG: hypothetical protein ACLVG1_11025 [Monoglobus pectinilyticus]|uniref:hypothetical protein n=1 Tax=Monoglobus pectinilyticus TaxID=1981510 RepID=UPI00399BCD1E